MSGSSAACWPVLSLQVRSEGSSSQYAPVRSSSAWWNDCGNDRPAWRRVSVFSDAEPCYLGSQRLGRLAIAGQNGVPHVVPVAFRCNADADRIDIGGLQRRP
jgi:hypothetical protein